jgi:hypothetical protein
MSIIDWSYSKYIVGTSFLFQIPCYYAYMNQCYYCASTLCITSLLSINYWRDCKYSWRRTMDIWWSRVIGGIYIYYAFYHIPKLTMFNTTIMGWFYCQSNLEYKKNPCSKWYIYHMLFHLAACINQSIFVYYIK